MLIGQYDVAKHVV